MLGGGVEKLAPEYGTSNLQPYSMERLRYGVWLARQTGAPLAFSGGVGHAQRKSVSEAEVAARIAREEYGRPLKWIEAESRDTRENAARTVALLKPAGVDHIVLVTHWLHMPRALRAFREAAGSAMRIEAAPMSLAGDTELSALSWVPSNTGFVQMRYALREMARPSGRRLSAGDRGRQAAAGCPVARRNAASSTSGAHGFCRISKPCLSRRCEA